MKDISDQRFGRLIAIRPTETRKHNLVVWECICDCGNTVFITSGMLTGGNTKSCGCLRKDNCARIGAKNKQTYTKDLTGQRFGRIVAVSQTNIRKNGAVVWECKCDCGNIAYVTGSMLTCGNTRSCGCLRKDTATKIHTFMPVTRKGEQETGGRNLRKNNTSGYPGIGYRAEVGKYTAEIGFQWKTHYLGVYRELDDAIDVRKKAEALILKQGRAFYAQWKKQAEADPVWAKEHPVQIRVTKKEEEGYSVAFYPEL